VTWLGTRGLGWKSWKYRVATLLDRLPGTCWARLVGWVEYGSPLRESRDLSCHSQRCGGCYCGKLRRPESGGA